MKLSVKFRLTFQEDNTRWTVNRMKRIPYRWSRCLVHVSQRGTVGRQHPSAMVPTGSEEKEKGGNTQKGKKHGKNQSGKKKNWTKISEKKIKPFTKNKNATQKKRHCFCGGIDTPTPKKDDLHAHHRVHHATAAAVQRRIHPHFYPVVAGRP